MLLSVTPTEMVKGSDDDLWGTENLALIKASFVIDGLYPPIPVLVEAKDELYRFKE